MVIMGLVLGVVIAVIVAVQGCGQESVHRRADVSPHKNAQAR
jgi:hypothetical protein